MGCISNGERWCYSAPRRVVALAGRRRGWYAPCISCFQERGVCSMAEQVFYINTQSPKKGRE